MDRKRYTPENITALKENEIFVFGSNLHGNHAGGAARVARKNFGAVPGCGVGLQGQSYAIPTMQGGVDTIRPYVDDFIEFAAAHPGLVFYVTRIGCGIAGFKDEEIALLFDKAFDLDNVVLPESFACIINHKRQLDSEISGIEFHVTPIKYSDEDLAKAETMTHEEKMEFFKYLKQNNMYSLVHESPERDGQIMNTSLAGHHVIAITGRTFAIAAGTKLYSNRFKWGMDFDGKILSVVAKDGCDKDFPYGPFVVLLADGSLHLVWSDSCIKQLSSDNDFVGVTSGCGGVVFGLRRNGTVATFMHDDNMAIAQEARAWSGVRQIEAGPEHVAVLYNDGTVAVYGNKQYVFRKVSQWKNIERIRVSRHTMGNLDYVYGIDSDGWLYVDGDTYGSTARHNWRKIESQYDVADVVENMSATLVRINDGYVRFITAHSLHNYEKDLEFIDKYKNFRFLEAYKGITVIVDAEGEFRVMNNFKEVHWWSYNLDD